MTVCKFCGKRFESTGTVNGLDTATWEYLGHLRDEHGEK